MFDFEQYMMSQGEGGVQWLLEQIERVDGVIPDSNMTLEERWDALNLQPPACEQQSSAA